MTKVIVKGSDHRSTAIQDFPTNFSVATITGVAENKFNIGTVFNCSSYECFNGEPSKVGKMLEELVEKFFCHVLQSVFFTAKSRRSDFLLLGNVGHFKNRAWNYWLYCCTQSRSVPPPFPTYARNCVSNVRTRWRQQNGRKNNGEETKALVRAEIQIPEMMMITYPSYQETSSYFHRATDRKSICHFQ